MFGENSSERERKREKGNKNSKRGAKITFVNSRFLFWSPKFGATSLFRGSRVSSTTRETTERARAPFYIYTLYYIFVEREGGGDKER
jgi:hypothetical protein